jgi:NADPH:quinone reductase-like Zn-dependent oxidoreductase
MDVPIPDVGPDDVRIAIRAASVNGFDVFQANGYMIGMMEHRFPAVIGRDFAGVVDAIGAAVTDVSVGDEVIGFVPPVLPLEHGSFAEWIVAADLVLARKPAGLDFEVAATLPLAGSAALDLLDAVDLAAGDTVLIVGATGGVGTFATQLAAQRGAVVIATARPDEEAYVRALGATQTVDWSAGGIVDAVRAVYPDGVTAVIDLVDQKDALTELGAVVRSGGRVATLLGAADVEAFAGRGILASNTNAATTPDKIRQLAEMVASDRLRVVIQETYPLDRAPEAIAAFQAGTRGKLVLAIGEG